MNVPLIEKFEKPLPGWLKEIEAEAYQKIASAPFAQECYNGDAGAIAKQMLGLWPFVNKFPEMVRRGCWGIISFELLWRFGLRDLRALYKKSKETLYSIGRDEEEHRALWLETSDVLGLKYPDAFYRNALPQTEEWIRAVDQQVNPFRMFVGFTSIEIIAESISKHLLLSETFRKVLGERGLRWFKAHVHPADYVGATHEELAWRLAITLHDASPAKEECNGIVQSVVGLFLVAADASRNIKLS